MRKRRFNEIVEDYKFIMVDSDEPIMINKNEELIERSKTLRKLTEPVIYLPFTSDVLHGLLQWIKDGHYKCDSDMQIQMEQLIQVLDLSWD